MRGGVDNGFAFVVKYRKRKDNKGFGAQVNEITQITPQIKDKRRCNIYIDGRFCCGLTMETAVKNRLKVGVCVAPEELAKMQLESEKNVAFDKALNFLSATKKTEKQLQTYLSGKGYLPAVIEHVMEKLRGYDFVNDGEYAKEYVGFAANRKGERLIKMELKAKGIAEEKIDAALQELDVSTQEDAAKSILGKYMKHKTADRESLAKAFRYLMSKGFDYDVAKSALAAFGDVEND